jgi:hypothetical protein
MDAHQEEVTGACMDGFEEELVEREHDRGAHSPDFDDVQRLPGKWH